MTYQSWTADSADISTFFIFPSVSQFVMVHLDLNLNAATLTDIWSSTQIQIKVLCYTPIIKTFNFSAAFWDWGYVCVFFFFNLQEKKICLIHWILSTNFSTVCQWAQLLYTGVQKSETSSANASILHCFYFKSKNSFNILIL